MEDFLLLLPCKKYFVFDFWSKCVVFHPKTILFKHISHVLSAPLFICRQLHFVCPTKYILNKLPIGQPCRSLGHHLLHPQILILLVLLKPFQPRALFYRADCTSRFKFLTESYFRAEINNYIYIWSKVKIILLDHVLFTVYSLY